MIMIVYYYDIQLSLKSNTSLGEDPLNYRPISFTSVPYKVLERIIVLHITQYIDDNSIISDHQYGFRAGHSTVDQLILTYTEISTTLDNGNPTDLIFFDFSKAFDLVKHVIC